MKTFFFRTISYSLATIGFILGFTSKVLAQYGVWVASYKYIGQVKSEVCNEPIPGIKVTLETDKNKILSEAYTNEYGYFTVRYFDEYFEDNLILRMTDVDSTENKGDFISYTTAAEAFKNKNNEIHMSYKNSNPCETKTEPIIELADTTGLNTLQISELPKYEADTTKQNNKTPLVPEPLIDIIIYPNPNSGSFTLSYTLSQKENISVSVYSASGQLIYSESYISESGLQTKQLNMPTLAKGSYIVYLRTAHNVYTRNVIVQ